MAQMAGCCRSGLLLVKGRVDVVEKEIRFVEKKGWKREE